MRYELTGSAFEKIQVINDAFGDSALVSVTSDEMKEIELELDQKGLKYRRKDDWLCIEFPEIIVYLDYGEYKQ